MRPGRTTWKLSLLKNELKQTRELLQSEKEKKKRADSTIGEYQDKLRQAEREKEYALTHQKKVEIPVEKPVLYERCRNCDRKAYQQAKERYEHQRNGLEKKYRSKTVGFDKICIICEGNEEYEYLNRLKNLKVWNEQYDISLVNAGGNGNIPARYQDRYQNGADELVLVFCDTEKKPHEQYEDIKRKINEFHGVDSAANMS